MDSNIYTGIWTNWSRGPVLGLNLTTSKRNGNLLIAFTALFVTFVGSRLWRISCLALHRYYSTSAERSAIHHQRQVILRNSSAAESALYEFVSLFWTWRKSRFQHIAGLIPLAIFSACFLAAFTAAGGFSSSISSSVGDQVLINGQNCGIIRPSSAVDALSVYNQRISELSNSAANYVQQCYRTNQSNVTTACNKFVRSSLPTFTVNDTAECPFQNKICRNPQSTLRLDSGYIDSNDDLGLNSPKNERFTYRYVLHCAPLETDNYTSHIEEFGRGWDRYHYGNRTTGPLHNQTTLRDHIYRVADLDSQYIPHSEDILSGINYKLASDHARLSEGKSASWSLIPELVRPDADLTFAFLSGSGVRFIQPADDDWYRATTPYNQGPIYSPDRTENQPTWHPNVSASPMACLEQFQWCNSAYPRDRGCGPLGSYLDALHGAAPLFNLTSEDVDSDRPLFSDATRARILWSQMAMNDYPSTLAILLGSLGTRSLTSQATLYTGVQLPISNNQWQLDVLQWWHTILAAIQASRELHILAMVDAAQGPSDPKFLQYRSPPLNEQEQNVCNSQKIRSSAYTSFSCFGLFFTLIMGALITVTSYILEPILNYLHKRRKYKSYAHLEWTCNTSLQLHRMAHEQLGGQKWDNCTEHIPTTDPEVPLASLDISDPTHPILCTPEEPEGKAETVEPGPAPADSSSPGGGSLHSASDAHLSRPTSHLSGRTSMSSTASDTGGSSSPDVQTPVVDVNGQLSSEQPEHGDGRGNAMNVAGNGGHQERVE